jgi:hypothetical protein
VNLIADGRQWFKAEIGIGARELPLDVSHLQAGPSFSVAFSWCRT